MLEIDDIQHILLTRAPALTGRYEFLFVPRCRRWPGVVVSNQGEGPLRCGDARQRRRRQALGDGGFHLEWLARAGLG